MQNNVMESRHDKDRLEYLDIARGIGILLVVIGHHLDGYPDLTIWIYSFHMPLFFIISGWLYGHNPIKTDVKTLICKKAKSLLYPYLIFSILIIMWKYLLLFVLGSVPEEGFREIFIRSFSTYGYHALWFLPTLFICEVAVHHIESHEVPNTVKYAVYIAIAILAFYISELLKTMGTDTAVVFGLRYIGRALLAIMFYRIGMILYSVFSHYKIRYIYIYIGLLLGVSVLLCRCNGLVKMSEVLLGNVFLYMILALAGSLGVIFLSQCIGHSKVLSFWGRNSLIVMLTHMDFSIEIAYILLAQLGVSAVFSDVAILSVIAIAVELAIEAVTIMLVNKYFRVLLYPPQIKK